MRWWRSLVQWAAGKNTITFTLREERQKMEVSGKMLVQNFKAAFKEEFGVDIKVHQGFSFGQFASDGDTLASIRSKDASDESKDRAKSLDLHGNMTVSTVENAVKDALGFRIQVLAKDGSNADNGSRLSSLRG